MPGWQPLTSSAIRVSVIPHSSSSRHHSAEDRASRETSSASTTPTCPSAICSVSSVNPARAASPDPLTPRSASMTRTALRGQPSAPARLTRSYWRKVDSRLRSTWIRVD